MIRRYTRASYLERVRALQAGRAGLTVSTDIIVGFPGETEADFQQTLSLVEEAGFVTAFGFKYSPRPNTPALKLGDDISEEIKSERLDRLFTAVDRQQRRHLDALVGTRTRVLIEGPNKARADGPQHRFGGRSDRHEIVHVDVEAGCDPTGALLEVEIVEANKRSLLGRVLPGQRLTPPRPARSAALHLPVLSS